MRLSYMQVMRKCRPQLMEYHMESTFLGSCYAEVSQGSCTRVSNASIAPLNYELLACGAVQRRRSQS